MNALFFEADILGSEFLFFLGENNELLKIFLQQVDKTVFLNDSNCY